MTLLATLTLLVFPMASETSAHNGHHDHAHAGADAHGNPADFDDYVARMEAPDRAEWQKPDEVVKTLALRRGAKVCEIGPGPGYFTLRLARVVGPEGMIYAVDVEPRMQAVLADRLAKTGTRNVLPVLGLADDPLVPAGACDIVFIVNVLHHVDDPVAYLRRLTRSLATGGRIVDIDFHKRDTPMGPPPEMRIARDDVAVLAARAGLEIAAEHDLLPYQYFLELKPK